MDDATARAALLELYREAVAAVAPGPALARVLAGAEIAPHARPWIIALGKAALAMAEEAVRQLARRGAAPAGGVIVAPQATEPPHPSLVVAPGDHPEPGARSLAAAERVGEVASRVRQEDEVWVLLSGGTTSLVAAPVAGVSPEHLHRLFRDLLGSGMDIWQMNMVRKRFARWGAGRLAAELAPARVRVFVVSDVIGDDPGVIGSGPCAPDIARAADVLRLLSESGLAVSVPVPVLELLARAQRDPALETLKPGDAVFRRVTTLVIASNEIAVSAAMTRALSLGLGLRTGCTLAGEASEAGRLAATALMRRERPYFGKAATTRSATCTVSGGETVVTLPPGGGHGRGGRCQEVALAAARELARRRAARPDDRRRAWILAAGTDGRDGPTDAAGAIVDVDTWAAIRRAGRDPEAALVRHDAYSALDAVGALVRTGPTGTNVADLVIGLCSPPR